MARDSLEAVSDAPEDLQKLHRRFAVDLFNRSWDILDQAERTPADEEELLAVAFASRWHWDQIGGDEERAVGDHQIAKVASLLGHGDLALRYATLALERTEAAAWGGWRLAAAYEGMARAHAAAGDTAARAEWVAKTEAALAAIPDPEERQVIADQLATVP